MALETSSKSSVLPQNYFEWRKFKLQYFEFLSSYRRFKIDFNKTPAALSKGPTAQHELIRINQSVRTCLIPTIFSYLH